MSVATGVGEVFPWEACTAIACAETGRNVTPGLEDGLPGTKASAKLPLKGTTNLLGRFGRKVGRRAEVGSTISPKRRIRFQSLQRPSGDDHVLRTEAGADGARVAIGP